MLAKSLSKEWAECMEAGKVVYINDKVTLMVVLLNQVKAEHRESLVITSINGKERMAG